jgi:chemotaxis protein CheX
VDRIEIDDSLREALVEPFTAAVSVTLREMAQVEAFPTDSYRWPSCQTRHDLSARLETTWSAGGLLLLSFPRTTAEAFTERILAEVAPTLTDDVVRDCVGEIANVVAGQAKALLHGSPNQFTFSTPKVLTGAGQELPGDGVCVVLDFASEVGEFSVTIAGVAP